LDHAFLGRRVPDLFNVIARMAQRDGFDVRGRRLDPDQRLEFLLLQHALDRPQPVRPLGMAWSVVMIEGSGMRDEKRGHAAIQVRSKCDPSAIQERSKKMGLAETYAFAVLE
jgi:hypothetical protein